MITSTSTEELREAIAPWRARKLSGVAAPSVNAIQKDVKLLNLSPTPLTFLSRVQALSETGTCYPFDSRANGMVIGEGAGVVLLKPLQQAIADGDYIHAVIKGLQ